MRRQLKGAAPNLKTPGAAEVFYYLYVLQTLFQFGKKFRGFALEK